MASSQTRTGGAAPRTLGSRLARAWDLLTLPPAFLPEDHDRRTRLLSALILGLVALFVAVLVGMFGFGLGQGELVNMGGAVLAGLIPLLLGAYALNQRQHHTLATLLVVGVTSAASWLLVMLDATNLFYHPELFFYPIVAIILAALLLPGALTLLTGLVNLIVLVALRRYLPMGYDPLSLVSWYVLVTGLIGIASAVHRRDLARLEGQTQALEADVRARQQAEAALSESEQRFHSAFEFASIGVALVNTEGQMTQVNPALCDITGYSAEELLAISVEAITHPDDLAADQHHKDQLWAGKVQSYQLEKRYIHKEGHSVWVAVSASSVRSVTGQPLYFVAQVQDVSERRAAVEALRESNERFRAMLEEAQHLRQFNASIAEVMAEGLVLENAEGLITLINPKLTEMLGYAAPELIGRPSLVLITPSAREAVQAHAQRRALGETSRYETRLLARDGREIPALISGTPLSKDGVFTGTLATIVDITERKQTEVAVARALTESERRERESALLNEMSSLLQKARSVEDAYREIAPVFAPLFQGDSGRLVTVSEPGQPAVEGIHWGAQPEPLPDFELEGCQALQLKHAYALDLSQPEAHNPGTLAALVCSHVAWPWPTAYVCIPLVTQDETLGVLHLAQTPATAQHQTAAEWLEHRQQLGRTVADSLALALHNLRLREQLRQQSIRDPLTGLFNRRYLEETLDREIHRARREGRPVGVVLFDIDFFKRFNDTLGHEAGDYVLREFGHLLRDHTRGEDVACRYGGEEFTLLMPGAPLAATQERAELLRAAVAALEGTFRGQPLSRVTVSAGVAMCPDHGASGEAVLRAADKALYAAKAAGRNRVVVAVAADG